MANPDRFGDTGPVLDAPATKAFAITPHDTTKFDENVRAIYVGVGGDIVIVVKDGESAITFKNAQTGSIIPIRACRVNSTSTTATNLVGLI